MVLRHVWMEQMFGGNPWAKQQLRSCLQFGGIELSSLGGPFLSRKCHRLCCIVFIGMSLKAWLKWFTLFV